MGARADTRGARSMLETIVFEADDGRLQPVYRHVVCRGRRGSLRPTELVIHHRRLHRSWIPHHVGRVRVCAGLLERPGWE